MPRHSATPSGPNEVERRKRRPTRRVTENGDPLVNKKAKTTTPLARMSSTTSSAAQSQNSTTDSATNASATNASTSPPCAQARDGDETDIASENSEPEAIEVSDGDDDADSVELVEEDDEAELGTLLISWCEALQTD
jgi:hypothetical protein